MKTVGIISLYYKNYNYGGLLQAYALQKIITKSGNRAEQISWDFCDGLKRNSDMNFQSKNNIFFQQLKNAFFDFVSALNHSNQAKRRKSLQLFAEIIPHTKMVYTYRNINEVVGKYDIFVTGSDQVWNMSKYNPEQFLDFVPSKFPKVSYAASMPDVQLTNGQKKTVKNHLMSFQNISVRERITANMLTNLLERKVQWVLDPTLLLDREEWEKISLPYKIETKYIFCYFLGGRKDLRRVATTFAKKEKLEIATFSHLGCTNISDLTFGDYKIYDARPEQFLYLIRNAEYVLTDSFHAAVFSFVFKTKYFVFPRVGGGAMDSRIISLLEIFNELDRFCTQGQCNINYLLSIKDKPVSNGGPKYLDIKEESLRFINCSLS